MANKMDAGITWDETPVKPAESKDTGVTWDKPGILESMKQGFQQAVSPEGIAELSERIPPSAAGRMASTIKFGTGVARLPANVMKMAGVEGPANVVNQANQAAEQLVKGSGYTGVGPDVANFAGEMLFGGAALKGASKLAPAVSAIPGGAAVVQGLKNSPMSQAIVGGMGLGAAGSTGEGYDLAKQAVLSGALGGAGQSIASGVGHLAAPVLKRYKELKSMGLSDAEILKDTTIGQLLGGKTQSVENALGYVPFGGVNEATARGIDALKNVFKKKSEGVTTKLASEVGAAKASLGEAQTGLDVGKKSAVTLQQRAAQDAELAIKKEMDAGFAAEKAALKATEADVHVPIVNYALKDLGIEVPAGLTGNKAMKFAQDTISDSYKKSLEGIGNLRLTRPTQEELRSLSGTYNDKYLGKEYAERFSNDIERLIDSTTKGKWLTPDNWQRNLSELSKDAYQMRQKDPRYSKALYDLQDKWMDLIEGQVGGDLFKATNTAFSKFKVPEGAAAYSKSIKAEGEFSPNELINSIRNQFSTKRLAGGEDEVQKLAVEAQKKIMADREALAAAQKAKLEGFQTNQLEQGRALEDVSTNMGLNVGKQKGELGRQTDEQINALNQQAKSQTENYQTALDDVAGEAGKLDAFGRRVGYSLGAGGLGLGGFGLSRLGVDPYVAAALTGGAIGSSRGLYSAPVQELLKRQAIKPRPEMVQQIGRGLQENSQLGGLALQNIPNKTGAYNPETGEEIIAQPQGGLDIPR